MGKTQIKLSKLTRNSTRFLSPFSCSPFASQILLRPSCGLELQPPLLGGLVARLGARRAGIWFVFGLDSGLPMAPLRSCSHSTSGRHPQRFRVSGTRFVTWFRAIWLSFQVSKKNEFLVVRFFSKNYQCQEIFRKRIYSVDLVKEKSL